MHPFSCVVVHFLKERLFVNHKKNVCKSSSEIAILFIQKHNLKQ